MKILFLDDDPIRTKKALSMLIGHDIRCAETAEQAIAYLKASEVFDIVSLDHDLGELQMVSSGKNTGYEVAEYISKMQKHKLPKSIIIHSYNPAGASYMKSSLSKKINTLIVEPFGCKGYWDTLEYLSKGGR